MRFLPAKLSRAVGVALLALVAAVAASLPSAAAEVKVAVAANFTEAAKEIGALFEQETGRKAFLSVTTSPTEKVPHVPAEITCNLIRCSSDFTG
ncbi:MAG: hypothetical protein ACK4TP_02300 [Hyphomicrobium sp.]|jgi:ABC-type molybdate transport system substrate-binding protein